MFLPNSNLGLTTCVKWTRKIKPGTISNTRDLYFESSARSVGGFSGGPVARTSDNYVVGVNHGYYKLNPETETGARITQDMINIIRENM